MGNTASFSPHSRPMKLRIYSLEQKYFFSGHLPKNGEMF